MTWFWRLLRGLLLPVALMALPVPVFARDKPAPAITSQIKSAATGKFKKFYKGRGFLPIWARGGTIGPAADKLVAVLRTAGLDGLDPGAYDPDGLKRAIDDARRSPALLGKTELKLSKALYAYARDLRDPAVLRGEQVVYSDRRLVPQRMLPADVLLPAGIVPSLDDYVAGIGWMNPLYVELRSALANFREHWDSLPGVTITPGPVLRATSSGARVADLRRRLGMPASAKFDKALGWKVKVFQMEHGLPATGSADAATVAALNGSSAPYEERLALNMKRARLLPASTTRHIVVNIASATLMMFDDGKLQGDMRVVVGKPDEQTPVMAGMLTYAILNPYWNIPTDLVRDRVAPKVLAGQPFSGMHYEALSDWTVNARVIDASRIDWKAVADGRVEPRIRMLPGGENWMGKMKFMFPNDLGIYLHDFPDKAIFSENGRQLSSGCVRLSDAPRLGKWLFGRPLQAPSNVPEQYMPLQRPVPVYITYLTVVPDGQNIAFLQDGYGKDGAAPQRLAAQ